MTGCPTYQVVAGGTPIDMAPQKLIGELADLAEDMIGRKLNGRQIWTELMDHHDYLVTYDSIRHYIRYTRPRTASAQAESLM
jgi:hypothetical protein